MIMKKILFFPLNTNHVYIFNNIVQYLSSEYLFISHDYISDSPAYHTSQLMEKLKLPFIHFSERVLRKPDDNFFNKFRLFFKLQKVIKFLLAEINPNLVVLCIDNDPIAQIFVKMAKRQSIKTILIQEALVRPFEYMDRPTYFSDYTYKILRFFGIFLNYIQYGTAGCDKILVAGERAKSIYIKRGIPEEKCVIVGQPKFDTTVKKIQEVDVTPNRTGLYLYAASTKIIKKSEYVSFLKKLMNSIEQNGLMLIIKLHPRTAEDTEYIKRQLTINNFPSCRVIKEGDDTFELLKKADVLITISSTVILEALMLKKDCIVVDYLAGESKLNYGSYDAVYSIANENEIDQVIKKSINKRKSKENKLRLLLDELYKLDGCSGKRAADFLEMTIY